MKAIPTTHVVASLGLLALSALTVGAANLTITVTHDDLPTETIWTFTDQDTGIALFRQDENNTWTTLDPQNRSETFVDLAPGNYQFEMEDLGMDGICCQNGTGMITFSNETEILYQQDGNFTYMLKIDLQVNAEGYISSITPLDTSSTEMPSSDIDVDGSSDPDVDADWPGFMNEDAQDHSFTINVKFADQPQTVLVEILKKDDTYFNTGWLNFYLYSGVANDANTLWSETFENLKAGIYFVRVTDDSTDGLDWATLTNNTDVVWQVNSEDLIGGSAEQFIMVVGWHGYTIPTAWTGSPP